MENKTNTRTDEPGASKKDKFDCEYDCDGNKPTDSYMKWMTEMAKKYASKPNEPQPA